MIQMESRKQARLERRTEMKGFFTANGYCGLVDGRYVLFASESDYREYMNDAA